MAKNAVSIRIEEDKIDELDQLASLSKRDRSFLINEAIDLYLQVHHWQVQHIKSGLAQANQGQFASEAEVKKAFAEWQK